MQAKLEVSHAGDPLEVEADAIADRVVEGGSIPTASSGVPAISRAPETTAIVAAGAGEPHAEAGPSPERAIADARGGGSSLAPPVRERMESAMGADFGRVRIHAGPGADQLAQTFEARAFTTESDVFFRAGEYRPDDREGQRLLAHELTHVVQQAGGRAPGGAKLHRDPTDVTGIQSPAALAAWNRYRGIDDGLAQLVTRIEQSQNVQLVVTTTPPPAANDQAIGNTRVEIMGNGHWVSPPRALMDTLDVGTPADARFRIVVYVSANLTETSAMSTLIHEFILHAEDFLTTIGEFRTKLDAGDALLYWQLNADTGPRSPQAQHNYIRTDKPEYNTPRAGLYRLFHVFVKSRYLREGVLAAQQGQDVQAFNRRAKARLVEQGMRDDTDHHTQNPHI